MKLFNNFANKTKKSLQFLSIFKKDSSLWNLGDLMDSIFYFMSKMVINRKNSIHLMLLIYMTNKIFNT